MTSPPRPVSISSGSRPMRIVAAAAVRRQVARAAAAPSRSEIIPRGNAERRPGRRSASPARLSAKMIPIAPAAFARYAFEANVQKPRETSAIEPLERAGGQRARPAFEVRRRAAEVAVDGLAVGAGDRRRRRRASGRSRPRRRRVGRRRSVERDLLAAAGAPATVTVSAGAKTCVFETAATVIASGAVPGEPTEPSPKSSRSLPAEITGTTPAAATLSDGLDERVVRRVDLGPAAGEVDHVHAVGDGGLERRDDLRRVGDVRRRGVGTLKTR